MKIKMTPDMAEAVAKARQQAQSLADDVEANNSKSHTAIRMERQTVAAKARDLASALKRLLDAQNAGARQHLSDALTALESAYKEINALDAVGDADVKKHNEAALESLRAAMRNLKHAAED